MTFYLQQIIMPKVCIFSPAEFFVCPFHPLLGDYINDQPLILNISFRLNRKIWNGSQIFLLENISFSFYCYWFSNLIEIKKWVERIKANICNWVYIVLVNDMTKEEYADKNIYNIIWSFRDMLNPIIHDHHHNLSIKNMPK